MAYYKNYKIGTIKDTIFLIIFSNMNGQINTEADKNRAI